MNEISIVILAAGLGTRMKSNKAKVLQKISDEAMIWHILNQAFELSDDVSVVLAHQKEEISKEILANYPKTQILSQDLAQFPGTAGALKEFSPKNAYTLILCGDMPLIKASSLKEFINENALNVGVFHSKEPKNYGRIELDEKGNITQIVELKDANEAQKKITLCNAGVYGVKTSLLKELLPRIKNENAAKEYYLTDLVKFAVQKNELVKPVYVDEAEFMGVNDKFELSIAEKLMQERIKKDLMIQGVIMRNPASIFIGARVVFEGECELEENVRITGASVIVNSHIKSSSVIEESKVINSDVGPLAHLRPKCEISNTHIGNFVECKNAKLQGVKAGHLSYLGDCEIDEGTNIGCGTITCNYDGVKKHKTLIGKKVFVGSHTHFIAPVEVEDEVIIAAGSSVSGVVPKGSLFITRAEKKIKKDYYYKKFQ